MQAQRPRNGCMARQHTRCLQPPHAGWQAAAKVVGAQGWRSHLVEQAGTLCEGTGVAVRALLAAGSGCHGLRGRQRILLSPVPVPLLRARHHLRWPRRRSCRPCCFDMLRAAAGAVLTVVAAAMPPFLVTPAVRAAACSATSPFSLHLCGTRGAGRGRGARREACAVAAAAADAGSPVRERCGGATAAAVVSLS